MGVSKSGKKQRKKGAAGDQASASRAAGGSSSSPKKKDDAPPAKAAPVKKSAELEKSPAKGSDKGAEKPLASSPQAERPQAMARPAEKTPFDLASPRESAALLVREANQIKDVSVYFEDETFVTYESSRIPWWVRLMWLGFWLLAFFYVANNLWPDAQRYFGT